ncbi:MAG: tRNA (adenosine(37)-N6)-threonylcarbamoyltransferase complex dimerization subunit type 1 TsaB [Cyclobacteriaceae bacterium]
MILTIETSGQVCSIAVHSEGILIAGQVYNLQKSHSALLPGIVNEVLSNAGLEKSALQAVAISAGPGSYTGLRIGVSTAKGLCYGLGIPLIAIDTLDLLAANVINQLGDMDLAIPCLDARRMEVYAKVIGKNGHVLMETTPVILNEDSFDNFGESHLTFLGSGAHKCDVIERSNYLILKDKFPSALEAGTLVHKRFLNKDFEDVAYFEPNYLKAFQTKPAKNLLA